MEILNDVEKAAVQKFMEFETMREAVKKVLLAGLHSNGTLTAGAKAEPLINGALTFPHQHPEATDEVIGQHARAYYAALMALEEAFKHLEDYKKVEEKPKQANRAR